MADQSQLRNFSIVAHIDHGKSTLADRFLELTGTVPQRLLRDQFLDQLELERERGITIKLQPVRMSYGGYVLNLIDTPGHVDFTDEVSRSLAAVEGVLLLADATQGIQAQTVAHYRRARALGLTCLPVVNKIDLANADPERVARSLGQLVGTPPEAVLRCSAKTGAGVAAILQAIVDRIPAPPGDGRAPLRALIIDSLYDPYLGVVAYLRVVDGQLRSGQRVRLIGSRVESTVLDVGTFHPDRRPVASLSAGEIGYAVTGLKTIAEIQVGDTLADRTELLPLQRFAVSSPVVFASLFPAEGEDVERLRSTLAKLQLNDASLTFQAEHRTALGYGFRCGFLGLLHLDVVRERLQREFGLRLLLTYPSVVYRCRVARAGGERTIDVRSPADLPSGDLLRRVEEPWALIELLTPAGVLGSLLQLIREARGTVRATETFGDGLLLTAEVPLASILVEFSDRVKSVSAGYASLNTQFLDYRTADVVKLEVRLNGEPVEALAAIVARSEVQRRARSLVDRLVARIPRAQFEIRLQAAVGGDILAARRIPPLRKDVTAKLYGGDVTRKLKLIEKQRRGKRRLRSFGTVRLDPAVITGLLTSSQPGRQ